MMILLFVFYTVILFLVSCLISKYCFNGLKRKALLFIGTFVFLVTVSALTLRFLFPLLPLGYRHFWYVATTSELHEPILVDSFSFTEKGHSKEFPVELQYYDLYSIGLRREKGDLPEEFQFNGIVRVDIYCDSKLLLSQTSNENTVEHHKRFLASNDSLGMVTDKIALISFDSANLEPRNNIVVKVTVIEPDAKLEVWKDEIRLYIGIDWTE